MKIEIPLQDGQYAEIKKKGDGFVSLKVKDSQEKEVEIFLNEDEIKQITGSLKIV